MLISSLLTCHSSMYNSGGGTSRGGGAYEGGLRGVWQKNVLIYPLEPSLNPPPRLLLRWNLMSGGGSPSATGFILARRRVAADREDPRVLGGFRVFLWRGGKSLLRGGEGGNHSPPCPNQCGRTSVAPFRPGG